MGKASKYKNLGTGLKKNRNNQNFVGKIGKTKTFHFVHLQKLSAIVTVSIYKQLILSGLIYLTKISIQRY